MARSSESVIALDEGVERRGSRVDTQPCCGGTCDQNSWKQQGFGDFNARREARTLHFGHTLSVHR